MIGAGQCVHGKFNYKPGCEECYPPTEKLAEMKLALDAPYLAVEDACKIINGLLDEIRGLLADERYVEPVSHIRRPLTNWEQRLAAAQEVLFTVLRAP